MTMPEHLVSKAKLKEFSDLPAFVHKKTESIYDSEGLRANERHITLWPRRWCFLIITIRKDAEVLRGRLSRSGVQEHTYFIFKWNALHTMAKCKFVRICLKGVSLLNLEIASGLLSFPVANFP